MIKRSTKLFILSVLMAVGSLLSLSYAYAETDAPAAIDRKEVAHVVWVKGSFYAKAPDTDEKRILKTSGKIFMNDTLITSAGSEAEIVFSDNSVMSFRAETKFYINEYNYQPKAKNAEDKSAGRYVMDLIEGGFRTVTGYVAKDQPDNYQVNTPVATIGVRGTEYSVVLAKDGQLFMKRYKGTPCVAKGTGSSKEKDKDVCLNSNNRYSVTDASGNTQAVVQEPDVFNVDVEVVPVTFSGNSQGFCGINGCGGNEGGGSGFCIQ